MIRETFGMIEQAGDDLAIADLSASTLIYHALKFTLQNAQLFNALLRFK